MQTVWWQKNKLKTCCYLPGQYPYYSINYIFSDCWIQRVGKILQWKATCYMNRTNFFIVINREKKDRSDDTAWEKRCLQMQKMNAKKTNSLCDSPSQLFCTDRFSTQRFFTQYWRITKRQKASLIFFVAYTTILKLIFNTLQTNVLLSNLNFDAFKICCTQCVLNLLQSFCIHITIYFDF